MTRRGLSGGATGAERRFAGWAAHASCRSIAKATLVVCCAAAIAGCSGGSRYDSKLGVSSSERVVRSGPIPKGGGTYKVGKPYKVAGKWFHPSEDPSYDAVGTASWYGSDFHGRRTANGEVFDMHALSAAHPTLPLPTYARVTNVKNGNSVVVRINDRGPFAHNRLIDLSKRAADTLDFRNSGTAQVRVQYVGPASLDGNDEWLTTTVRNDGQPMGTTMLADATPQVPAEQRSSANTYAALAPSTEAPAPAPAARSGPVPSVSVSTGGNAPQPTLAWVTGPGYAPVAAPRSAVDAAFSLFDR